MRKVTYPTDDGGAIHEYNKLTDAATPEIVGEEMALEESVINGISIIISGSDINRISDINICFKEDK